MMDLEQLKVIAADGDIKGSVVIDLIARCERAEKDRDEWKAFAAQEQEKSDLLSEGLQDLAAELKEICKAKSQNSGELIGYMMKIEGYWEAEFDRPLEYCEEYYKKQMNASKTIHGLGRADLWASPEPIYRNLNASAPVPQSRDSAEPVNDNYMTGENYTAGLWSRANIEAFIRDGNSVQAEQSNATTHSEQPPAVAVPELSDDDLWHIAKIVSRLSGGSLFNVSQDECVLNIRAGFVEPDTAGAMLSASPQPNVEQSPDYKAERDPLECSGCVSGCFRCRAQSAVNTGELLKAVTDLIQMAGSVSNIAYNLGQGHADWSKNIYPRIKAFDEQLRVVRAAIAEGGK